MENVGGGDGGCSFCLCVYLCPRPDPCVGADDGSCLCSLPGLCHDLGLLESSRVLPVENPNESLEKRKRALSCNTGTEDCGVVGDYHSCVGGCLILKPSPNNGGTFYF